MNERKTFHVAQRLFLNIRVAWILYHHLHLQSKLFSPELPKCYFLDVHKKIRSKVPILLYSVGPKHSSGNCYVSFFLTDKTFLHSVKIQIMGGKV